MRLLSLQEWAKREGINDSHARRLAIQGLVEGAYKIGSRWVVPEPTTHERKKPGRKAQ